MAQRYWAAGGVAGKIELRLAPALETLDKLIAQGQAGRFDLAFIDADKENYDGYYERALRLVRPGGLVMLDNVLWGGDVADPRKNDSDTAALRALNVKLQGDRARRSQHAAAGRRPDAGAQALSAAADPPPADPCIQSTISPVEEESRDGARRRSRGLLNLNEENP